MREAEFPSNFKSEIFTVRSFLICFPVFYRSGLPFGVLAYFVHHTSRLLAREAHLTLHPCLTQFCPFYFDNLLIWNHSRFVLVCGRFTDISAKSFFRVQLDLEYRKVWDKYVIQLDCVERDDDNGSEVIHWVTHFPVSHCGTALCCKTSRIFLRILK